MSYYVYVAAFERCESTASVLLSSSLLIMAVIIIFRGFNASYVHRMYHLIPEMVAAYKTRVPLQISGTSSLRCSILSSNDDRTAATQIHDFLLYFLLYFYLFFSTFLVTAIWMRVRMAQLLKKLRPWSSSMLRELICLVLRRSLDLLPHDSSAFKSVTTTVRRGRHW